MARTREQMLAADPDTRQRVQVLRSLVSDGVPWDIILNQYPDSERALKSWINALNRLEEKERTAGA